MQNEIKINNKIQIIYNVSKNNSSCAEYKMKTDLKK